MDYRIDLWNAAPGVSSPPHLGSGSVQVPTSISGAGIHGHGAGRTSEPRRDESDSPPAKAKPILVLVDDEPDVLQSVHDLLRMEYEVHTFEHGPDALEFLRKNPVVHVILSDQRMPGMSGVEVLRQAMAIRPETTRLLFTAYSDLRAVVDAINQGNVFRYLAKPCEPEFLFAIVRQAVEHHDLIVEKNTLLAELQASNAKLLEANRVKGAFIEVVSHELNTPLTVVLGMIDLWKMSQSATASPIERQWVERIGAAAMRLARTVERMLKLVRNRDFSQSLNTEVSELEPIARQVVEELAPYLELRRQTVTVLIEPDVGRIEVDPGKIADVLINLLANAIKFTPDGGTIRLEARNQPSSPGRDPRRGRRRRGGCLPRRARASLRAVLHRLRHVAPLLRRLPVRQAGHRTGPLPGEDLRPASRRPRRSLEHARRRLDVCLCPAAIAEQPRAGLTRACVW